MVGECEASYRGQTGDVGRWRWIGEVGYPQSGGCRTGKVVRTNAKAEVSPAGIDADGDVDLAQGRGTAVRVLVERPGGGGEAEGMETLQWRGCGGPL